MGLKIGIVGLPNVGKSTIFNALTRTKGAQVANYPFCTIEPNVGVVEVPDDRLGHLAKIVTPEKIVPAIIEFVDIAGLVEGASKGEGLGNKFLSHIRECDAIAQVVRVFEQMGNGILVSNIKLTPEEKELLRDLHLITAKPFMYIANVHEGEISKIDIEKIKKDIGIPEGATLIPISAKIEEELVGVSKDEADNFLHELGLTETGLNSLIRNAYELLRLRTYFTAGPKEVKAWTIKAGDLAPRAAGVIHTDFEKGFIRAEVIGYGDYVNHGGETGAKEKGALRVEGKDYEVKDGDVMHFRFSK